MTKDEVLKLALEALELHLTHHEHGCVYLDPAVTAIKEALAQPEQLREENERLHVENRRLIDRIETIGVPVGVGGYVTTTSQPEQEPVACVEYIPCCTDQTCPKCKAAATPPQRKPLTDEEIENLYFDKFSMGELKAFARAIEAAHGIKELV